MRCLQTPSRQLVLLIHTVKNVPSCQVTSIYSIITTGSNTNKLFGSKIVEKVVAKQLLDILEGNNIFSNFQWGFRKNHSMSIALHRVTNNTLMSADSGGISVFISLDLSTASDTADQAWELGWPGWNCS